jgi:hypothetical protein
MRASMERQTGQVKLHQENDQNLYTGTGLTRPEAGQKEGYEDGKDTTQRYRQSIPYGQFG